MCRRILAKVLSTKFHENPSGRSRSVPCRETKERIVREPQTHKTTLTVIFRNCFVKEPKNAYKILVGKAEETGVLAAVVLDERIKY